MGRKSLGVTRKARIPGHITKISMTPNKYYELKVYIKSVVVPGTPAFELRRLSHGTSKNSYHLWLHKTLEDIGPRFFPSGTRGLAWPDNYDQIYKAVHQVVRVLSIGIRKNYYRREPRAAQRGSSDDEMEMAQDEELHEGEVSDDTDSEEDVMVLNKDRTYVQREQEEEKRMAIQAARDQENQDDDTVEEGMDAEPIELEDLLGLMKPEVFANFPNVDDEYFDWDEILDPSSPEPVCSLAHLDHSYLSLQNVEAKYLRLDCPPSLVAFLT
ncbi:unnamed protein product [Tuber aestivum]|uniref:Uncharacterized protein n=1 Tax=Tuber aestivum TaxID=59557 RepID=A0A292Q1R0_9PEZI|nr:unnamed protein product [Tuber aestivum]